MLQRLKRYVAISYPNYKGNVAGPDDSRSERQHRAEKKHRHNKLMRRDARRACNS